MNETFPNYSFSDYEVRSQLKEEISTDNNQIDQTDSAEVEESSKPMDIDEDFKSLRGKIQAYISNLIQSKTNKERDNDKEKAEFSQEQSDFIENIVIEFKSLLKRVNALLAAFIVTFSCQD